MKFENFRNLKKACFEPCEGVNVIYGDNAQGKTNILEAVWLFGGGHSFRGAKESELINFESASASIEMDFIAQGYEQNAKIIYSEGKKEVIINGISKNGAALAEKFPEVVFSPEHMTLVKKGPSERRKFLDGAIARKKLRYAVMLSRFNKTLQQRNALLKDIFRHPELKEILSVWDASLSNLGARVVFERKKYIELLDKYAKKLHSGISGGTEELSVAYSSSVCYEDNENEKEFLARAEKSYFEALQKSVNEDIRAGSTQTGPHRDDIEIILNGTPARNFGSQGQQRSIVISLKLAEAGILKETVGEEPIIILDDVLSELDSGRQDFLLNKIKSNQVFLSCCEPSDKEQLVDGKVFNIVSGKIFY